MHIGFKERKEGRWLWVKESERVMSESRLQSPVVDDSILLRVTHSNLKTFSTDLRFSPQMPVESVKEKLWRKCGTSVESMDLELYDDTGAKILNLSDNCRPLGFYSPQDGYRLHVIDLDPSSITSGGWLEDTSSVEKYSISEEAYDKLGCNFRKFKENLASKNPSAVGNKILDDHMEYLCANIKDAPDPSQIRQRETLPPICVCNPKLGKEFGMLLSSVPVSAYVFKDPFVSLYPKCPTRREETNPPNFALLTGHRRQIMEGEHRSFLPHYSSMREMVPLPPHIPSESTSKVGDRCEVEPGGKRGVVKFVGRAETLAPGFWIGIQYDEPLGKHDGMVKGKRYFDCPPLHGAIVRPDKVKVGDYPERDPFEEEEI